MSDFVNGFWGYFISVVAVGGVVWCVWLLYTQRRWLSTSRPTARSRTPAMSGTAT